MRTNLFKLMATLFVAALSIGFTACGGDDDGDDYNDVPGTLTETYTVETPGQLPELISPEKKSIISTLKVKGPINGTDLRFIREMAGRDVNGNIVNGAALKYLDLSEAKIVAGGLSYYGDLEVKDNVLGKNAFDQCELLKEVALPSSLTSIEMAFSRCTGLTSITIPNSVTSIGSNAFQDCSGLTSITIPNSVTSIGVYAFSGCKGLTNIKVEEGNSIYDSRENCNAIIETASNTLITGCKNTIIPNSVKSIGESAFYKCTELTSITIPNSVKNIGSHAFSRCKGLTSVTIPNSVTSIGQHAFENCSSLTSVTIGNGVTSIGDWAFLDCSELTSITIPGSVTKIGKSAFAGCKGMKSATITNSVTSIGEFAFNGCIGLTSVTAMRTDPSKYNCSNYAFYNSPIATATLYVPTGCKNAYKALEPWKNFGTIVE